MTHPKILPRSGTLPGLEAILTPVPQVAPKTRRAPGRSRKPKAPPEPPAEREPGAGISLAEFVARPAGRKRGSPSPALSHARARAELVRLREEGRAKEFQARHFVAFYAELHAHVYKVEAEELNGPEWWAAVRLAEKAIVMFDGDRERMLDFFSWSWARERKKIQRSDDARRFVWRWQFSASTITDYRAELNRARMRAK